MTIATVNSIKYRYFSDDDISELTCLGISRTFTCGENDTLLLFLVMVRDGDEVAFELDNISPNSCGCCGGGDSISAYISEVREEIDDSDEVGLDEQSASASSSLS